MKKRVILPRHVKWTGSGFHVLYTEEELIIKHKNLLEECQHPKEKVTIRFSDEKPTGVSAIILEQDGWECECGAKVEPATFKAVKK